MKFGDKLTQLRRKNGLSQEELGEKLGVTRQTVSKWELGQSKPDTDKLMEISKLLDVDFNVLADDNLTIVEEKTSVSNSSDEVRPRKWLLILLIIIAIIIVIVLANKIVADKKAEKDNKSGIFDLFGIFEKIEKQVSGGNKDSFNWTYESCAGTKWGTRVSDLLDNVIKNNKTNKEHIITVVFNDLNSSDPNLIKESKKKLVDFDDYEVSLDYDDNGFVYIVTIEYLDENNDSNNTDVETNNSETNTNSNNNSSVNAPNTNNSNTNTESNNSTNHSSNNSSVDNTMKEFEKNSFNSSFEFYSGSSKGAFVVSLLDKVITSNNKNTSHIVRVIHGGTNTSDANEIRNIKNNIDKWSDYEVILDYDSNGYVSTITIK